MASLSLYNNTNGRSRVHRNDPFALARQLFNFDAFPAPVQANGSFRPAFDVKETEEAYLIQADLPGLKEDNLEVTLNNNQLTVSGGRTAEEQSETDNYHVYERRSGTFSRTFTLPKQANGDGITAKLSEGVLTVSVPKKPEAKARKIAVK